MTNKQKVIASAGDAGNLHLMQDWTSAMVCMALHSENQDVIVKQMMERFVFENTLNWHEMRRMSLPLWLKDTSKLKQLVEFVAKNEYKLESGEDGRSKAEASALWYILLKKIEVLKSLFNVEKDGAKYVKFLSSRFDQEKPRVVACKNAMALIQKKKYYLSITFFLLGEDLRSALDVALQRCNDPILAVLICKLYDPMNEKKQLDQILEDEFMVRGKNFNDPFLQHISMWHKKEFIKAVNQFQPIKQDFTTHMLNKSVLEFNLV